MTTIINASIGSTSGLITTADASGVLQLQVNNGTPSLTLNTAGAHGVGSSPSYGTTGQFLTSQGSAASPTWTTPSSGAMTLISTQTASASANLSWTGLSGYNKYMLIWDNLLPASATSGLNLVFGYGATPTYYTSNYYYSEIYYSGGALTGNSYGTGTQSSVFLTAGYGTSSSIISGHAILSGFTVSGITSAVSTFFYNGSNGTNGGGVSTAVPITAIKIFLSSNITSGTASLYGISS